MLATPLVDSKCMLGEGVQWNSVKSRVYWTDIFGNALWSCDETGKSVEKLALEGGLCAFAFTDNSQLLAAFTDGLYWMDPETGARSLVENYQPESSTSRMNDGGLDRQGRFIVGGIDEDEMKPTTPVWSVSPEGIQTIIEGVGCANSIVFSPDGKTMYFADTAGSDIFAYDYDTTSARPSNKRLFARMAEQFGKPDGSTVDSEGGLWNARFGGSCVLRFTSEGRQDTRVELTVPNVTCCCIGGKHLDRLFITTARILMTDEDLEAQPFAGGLFVADLNVTGIPHGTYKLRGARQ